MKHQHDTIEEEIRPSLKEIGGWALALQQLHHRLAPRFARPEPHHHALLYLRAVSSPHGDERNPCLKLRQGPLSERRARHRESGVDSPYWLESQRHACKHMSETRTIDRYTRFTPTEVEGTPKRRETRPGSIQRGNGCAQRSICSHDTYTRTAARSSVEGG